MQRWAGLSKSCRASGLRFIQAQRSAFAIALVVGPDVHDEGGLHGKFLLFAGSTLELFSSLTAF
ncbi:hypothetical protein [Comamonas aquatilis]|uniref:hypothetical protein n=1 Tax=Comamonas aquatilis TaxID=1778406 RepID=UPI0039EEEF73